MKGLIWFKITVIFSIFWGLEDEDNNKVWKNLPFPLSREELKERLAQCWSAEREWGGVCDPGGQGEDAGGGPHGGVSAQPAGALSPHLHHGLHTKQTASL